MIKGSMVYCLKLLWRTAFEGVDMISNDFTFCIRETDTVLRRGEDYHICKIFAKQVHKYKSMKIW